MVLPPPDVDDRIERYRTANTRKMERSLAILETIRRLEEEGVNFERLRPSEKDKKLGPKGHKNLAAARVALIPRCSVDL